MKNSSVQKFAIPGLDLLELGHSKDVRGSFTKIFQQSQLPSEFSKFSSREIYYSTSGKNVLRGMHFQKPPYDHNKLVHCQSGRVLDVVVDLRNSAGNFGKVCSFTLQADRPQVLIVPKGCAHGFLSLEDNSTLVYLQDSEYNQENDSGVLWNSIDFRWPIQATPILSERDMKFVELKKVEGIFD